MNTTLEQSKTKLQWKDGIGFLPIHKSLVCKPFIPYDRAYYNQCLEFDKTWQGRAVRKHRVRMVKKAVSFRKLKSYCLDVGCGTGSFIKELNRLSQIQTEGIDVCEYAIQWLHQNDLMPSRSEYNILTFWNSFQEIENNIAVIENYHPQFVAMSLPIFQDKENIVRSRHFKPEEVCWYYTLDGLYNTMKEIGYSLLSANKDEDMKCDQIGIHSFIFTLNKVV